MWSWTDIWQAIQRTWGKIAFRYISLPCKCANTPVYAICSHVCHNIISLHNIQYMTLRLHGSNWLFGNDLWFFPMIMQDKFGCDTISAVCGQNLELRMQAIFLRILIAKSIERTNSPWSTYIDKHYALLFRCYATCYNWHSISQTWFKLSFKCLYTSFYRILLSGSGTSLP